MQILWMILVWCMAASAGTAETSNMHQAWQHECDLARSYRGKEIAKRTEKYQAALALAERCGAESSEVQITLLQIAMCHVAAHDVKGSKFYYNREMAIVEKLKKTGEFKHINPEILVTMNALSDEYMHEWKDTNHTYCLVNVIALREISESDCTRMGDAYYHLGAAMLDLKKYDMAEGTLGGAIAAYHKNYLRNRYQIGQTWLKMGDAQAMQGFFDKADNSYKRALKISKDPFSGLKESTVLWRIQELRVLRKQKSQSK